jgi:hypothetical protein
MVVQMSARTWLAIRTILTFVVVAGLGVDAFVHFDLASGYAGVKSSALSQADLFRVEAALAVVAGVALLVRPRRYTAALAFLVSAGGTAAVLLYRYVDVGAVGPVPNMYEPIWYPEKTLSVWAEGVAAVAALVLLSALQLRVRRTTRVRTGSEPAAVVTESQNRIGPGAGDDYATAQTGASRRVARVGGSSLHHVRGRLDHRPPAE